MSSDLRACLGAVAERLGGRLHPGYDVVEGRVEGVLVTIEAVVGRTLAEPFEWWTTVKTSAPELCGNDLSIVRADGATPPVARLGAQETHTGDPRFDARFLVHADAPARACAWLGETLRHGLIACDRWSLTVDRGALELRRERVPDDADELHAAAVLAARFTGAERAFRSRWTERARQLDARPRAGAGFRFESARGLARVTLEPDVRGRRGFVCVRAPLPRPVDERFEITLAAQGSALKIRSSDPVATGRRLTEDRRAELIAFAPRLVHFDGRAVGVDVDGAEPAPAQLERAIRLVTSMTDIACSGPYR
jgi:hypothetical protein